MGRAAQAKKVKTKIEYINGNIRIYVADNTVASYWMEREYEDTGQWLLFRIKNNKIVGPIDKDVYRYDLIDRIKSGHYDLIDSIQPECQGEKHD